jgi:hypothetical protein
MVGLGTPSLVVNQDGRLVAKQVNMNAANLKKFAGLSSNTVVLNSKTKTPYWHQTVKYTNHQTLLNDMGRTLMSIPGVSFD